MRNRPGARAALATLLILGFTACVEPGGESSDTKADAGDACTRAAAHLAACALDLPAPALRPAEGAACDEAAAAAVLATDCPALRGQLGERKADGPLGALACRLGFFAACPVPACPGEMAGVDAGAEDAPEDCTARLDAPDDCRLCAYYDCREREARCGPDAYLVDYVGRYCRRFALVTEPRVSPAARAWLGSVRRCLVEWLDSNVAGEADCATIDREGTDSHALCYVQTGFCDLAPTDWLAILHTIDPGDAPFRVMLATAQGCLGAWLGLDRR